MKRVILSIALLLLSVISFAQKHERKVTAIEVEPSVGTYDTSTSISIEARYNFKSQWDIGLRECIDYCFTIGGGDCPITYDIVTDYNFQQGEDISFFIGAGLGYTTSDHYNPFNYGYDRYSTFHFMPRVGMELLNRVRLTAYYNTYKHEDETGGLGLSAGFVFGGSRIENRNWNIRHFEFEPFCGISTSGAAVLGLEARYNFYKPWDVGINTAIDFNGSRITAVGDYEFAIKKRATFFGGLGAGWALTSILNIDEALDKYGDACCAPLDSCICIYPRVGVELFEHLRLTTAVNTYNFKKAEFAITIGASICGGKRK